jgi:hypothetical protein
MRITVYNPVGCVHRTASYLRELSILCNARPLLAAVELDVGRIGWDVGADVGLAVWAWPLLESERP